MRMMEHCKTNNSNVFGYTRYNKVGNESKEWLSQQISQFKQFEIIRVSTGGEPMTAAMLQQLSYEATH